MRHKQKHRKIALILLLTIILSLFPNIEVSAAGGTPWDPTPADDNVKISGDGTMLQFMPSYQQKMGYNYGDKIFYKNFWQGQYGSFMPFRSGEKDWYGAMKSMKENSTNVYGRGGEYLVNPNDWNLKKGMQDPTRWGREAYMGDGTGTMYGQEHRYLGYVRDGSVFDNPLFPSDIYSGIPPANKDWYAFADSKKPADHQERWYNREENKMNPDDPNSITIAQYTIEKFFETDVGKTFKAINPDWKYWNKRLAILSDIRESAGVLKGWHRNKSDGRDYYQLFVVPGEPKTNTWITKMELKRKAHGEEDSEEVIGYRYREIDTSDPMNVTKMQIEKLSGAGDGVFVRKGETYVLTATMKYLNLKESETRDITEPGVINEELSTKTTPITIDRFYEFDETLNQSNVYDIELTGEDALLSYDNPERIGNFKEANFEWEFTVPNDVKKVMRFWVKVPVEFQENEDNLVPNDDWAFIEAAVLESDMVMRELELIDPETGEVVESFKREIDNLEPFNTSKEKLIRTNSDPRNASGLKKGKKYKVRAKYQYISFEEGKFDISKPELMTDKQRNLSTGVIPNELDVHYSYDDNVFKDGVFDESFKKISTDKPNIELKNLEYATFEWEYEVPEAVKKYIKIAGIVPATFSERGKDSVKTNNWAVVFGQIDPNDLGMHKNVRLINDSNETIKTYRKNEPIRLVFPVEHVKGNSIIGTDPVKNPKVTINVIVRDKDNKVIHEEKIQTNRLLKPEEIIDMPITKPFVTNSDKIIACAEIDPIHRELGYNENLKNDKICVIFKAGGIDIGMTEPVELYRNGQKVKFIEPNKNHTVQFSVRHFLGDEALGLDPVKNPKVKINMVVMDANNRLLLEQTVQTDQILRPGGVIKMPMSRNFSTETGMVRACATIDPIHRELGYNENPLNDDACASFMMVKNYAIRDLKAYPPSVHFGKNERTIEQDVTLTFTVINESSDELGGKLPSSPIVVIKHGSQVVWRNSVSISPGQSRKMSVTIPKRILRQGDNHFSVEVNPDRTILEFKPGVSDPYKDNKATTSIKGVEYAKCQECMTNQQRTRNDWKEKWEWYEQRGNVRQSTYSKCFEYETRTRRSCSRDEDGKRECETYEYEVCVDRRDIPYEYCEVTYRREWEEIHDYFETYQINDVLFRSKYTKDMAKKNGRGGDGWVSVKNGGYGMIKAGYGFELQIKTHYNTNRYRAPSPEPYSSNWYNGDVYGRYPSGYCDFRTRYPGVTPVEQPRHIYMEMPYVDRSGENVCYILDSTVSGPWYNQVRTFRLPLRSAFGGPSERKIYVNEKAKSNIDNPRKYRIDIVTPRPDKGDRFYGYYPENQVGNGKKSPSQLTSYLHDCTHFYLVIMPQDDIKTHIIQ